MNQQRSLVVGDPAPHHEVRSSNLSGAEKLESLVLHACLSFFARPLPEEARSVCHAMLIWAGCFGEEP